MPLFHDFAVLIAETGPATAMRESEVIFPVVQTFHIMGLGLIVGTVAIVDFRLLGLILRDRSAAALARQLLPLSWAGFAVMAISGGLLFAAQAERIWSNLFMQAKLLLLLLAGLNMLVFHLTTYRRIEQWGAPGAAIPLSAKGAAALSLLLWTTIVIAGRLIAYFG
jgi:hypothetical protein